MARELGLSVVPLTEMETFKSTIFNSGTHEVEKRGSCQIWVEANRELGERIEEAYQAFELFNPKWLPIQIPLFIQTWLMNQNWLELYATPIWNLFNLTKKRELIFNALPKEFFDLLAIVHILTGNGDGHPANYLLLRKEDEIGQKTIKIFLIDFGWSMPHAHASDALALRFLYDFRYLPQANYSFDAAGQETIRRISNRAQEIICEVGKFINQHQTVKANQIDSLEVENNRSAVDYTKQMKMMQERLQPLLWGIENNIPINKIAEVRSPDDYIRFFADRMNEGNGKFVPNWRREEVHAFLAKQQR